MTSTIVHSTLTTSTLSARSTAIYIAGSTDTSTAQQTVSSVPKTPPAPAAWGSNSNDGWSPAAIIGIVAAIVFLLVMVPLVAILLRRYERKRLRETVNTGSNISISSKSSVTEGQSLRSIIVTRELQRTSLKLAEGVDKPEQVHVHDRGWSRTEVRAGGLK